jgi:hypothetical protein
VRLLFWLAWFSLSVLAGSGYVLLTSAPIVHTLYVRPVNYVGRFISIEPCPPWASSTRTNASTTWPGDFYVCTVGARSKFIWEREIAFS